MRHNVSYVRKQGFQYKRKNMKTRPRRSSKIRLTTYKTDIFYQFDSLKGSRNIWGVLSFSI